MTLKPCIGCGEPVAATRCPDCALPDTRPRDRATRRNSTKWKNMSRRLRRMQPWCSVCGTRDDLTVDHRVPIELGGEEFALENLDVLCRSHNSAKGARVQLDNQGGHPGDVASPTARQAQRQLTIQPFGGRDDASRQ